MRVTVRVTVRVRVRVRVRVTVKARRSPEVRAVAAVWGGSWSQGGYS